MTGGPCDADDTTPTHATIETVRELVARHLPACATAPVTPLGEGADHRVYQVGDDLLVRLSRDHDPASRRAGVERERRLLLAVADLSPVPVPVPLLADADSGAMAYRRLPGVPMLALPTGVRRARARRVASRLGEVLAALHAAPVQLMREIAGVDDHAPEAWREEAAGILGRVGDALPETRRRAARGFVRAAPPGAAFERVTPRFTHNDLGIEHVLVGPEGEPVLGIIDWSDAAVTDPAVDFARILRDLGPAALEAALGAYAGTHGHEPALAERAWFYARCFVLEDLAFGLDTDAPLYVAKSREALDWLFPG